MGIMIQQGTNINRHIASAKRAAQVEECAKTTEAVYKGRQKACEMFYDVRKLFGAADVHRSQRRTGAGAGSTRLQGKSMDPILPLDISITRMAIADSVKGETVEAYLEDEKKRDVDALRTMGRKQLIPFGLYEVRGFISANLAAETGFDQEDLRILFEAILNMYEHDHSASKGEMSVVPIRWDPAPACGDWSTDERQRIRQAKLGCAPADKLFELVKVCEEPGVEVPRSYRDYDAAIDLKHIPEGVEVGFQTYAGIAWGKLPEDENWFHEA